MKYVLILVGSLALLAGLTTYVGAQDDTPDKKSDEQKKEADPAKDAKKEDAKKDDGKEDAEKKQPEWDGEVKTDLKNEKDPVNGKEIAKGVDHHVVYHGLKVRFAEEGSIKKFKRRPIQYMAKLDLERTTEGGVIKVDASEYKDSPTIPDTCPFMGNEIDTDNEVYILHRGYKIYFCCWMGCADKFLKEPSKYYDTYGLLEKDGKLVPKDK